MDFNADAPLPGFASGGARLAQKGMLSGGILCVQRRTKRNITGKFRILNFIRKPVLRNFVVEV